MCVHKRWPYKSAEEQLKVNLEPEAFEIRDEEEAVVTDRATRHGRGGGNPIGASNLAGSSYRLHDCGRFPVRLQVARTVKEGTYRHSTPMAIYFTMLQRFRKSLS